MYFVSEGYTPERLAEFMKHGQCNQQTYTSQNLYVGMADKKEIEELKKRVAWLEGVIDKLLTSG